MAPAGKGAVGVPRNSTLGETYLLCFDRPLKHARHYLGWAVDAIARDDEHEKPWDRVRILAACKRAGIGWALVRTWPQTTRAFERRLKNRGGAAGLCPLCKPEHNKWKREQIRARRQGQKERLAEIGRRCRRATKVLLELA